jgi:formylmethanofuran dehydrogenase subunit E
MQERGKLKMTEKEEIMSLVNEAVKLHGHLGPFLAIGVRMGSLAERTLNPDEKDKRKLQATVQTPSFTPFSCIIDGIQATTTCTVGNQRLKIRNSRKKIAALFETQNPNRTLRISVKPRVIEELTEKLSQGASGEQLAARIASMPAEQLFELKQR